MKTLLLISMAGLVGCGTNPTPFGSAGLSSASSLSHSSQFGATSCDGLGSPFGAGTGSATDPYQICSPSQLVSIQSRSAQNNHYILTTNLDMSSYSDFIIPGNFLGNFDGQGFSISNLHYTSASASSGLFLMNYGTISNLNVNASQLNKAGGALAIENHGMIQNCSTTNMILNNVTGIAGALVGTNDTGANILHSHSTGPVAITGTSSGYVGGLVGLNSGLITTSYSTVYVSADAITSGGLIGYQTSSGSVTNSYAQGNVSNAHGFGGGLIGEAIHSSSVYYNWSSGQISGVNGIYGGLIGFSDGSMMNCNHNAFDVTTAQTTAGYCGASLTHAQMQTGSSFTSDTWDLTTVWQMSGYPVLR